MKSERLFFIDAIRAFAILMMLQGHFIDTLLSPIYRVDSNLTYATWEYLRGITAPTFFTISGFIFLYLLLKSKSNGQDRYRIKKGFNRSVLLIVMGYALRMDVFAWIKGDFDDYFFVIDVLQCIGFSLITVIGFYVLFKKQIRLLSMLFLVLTIFCFLSEPLYRDLEVSNIPNFFANFLTKSNGSLFTLFPWFGYTAFGGYLATVFFNNERKTRFQSVAIASFLIFGVLFLKYSSWFLMELFRLTDLQILKEVAYHNHLFIRLGHVLLVFGMFYAAEPILKQSLIIKIGQKTLAIYIIHFIIIFGSFTGYGLNYFFARSLNPVQSILGAVIFMMTVCAVSLNYGKANTFLYGKLILFFNWINRKTHQNVINLNHQFETNPRKVPK